ncbi:hypothetical protein [Nonomuraea typhae]|uniref:hypothetical protein n=1 Tax=Nonomuraea typhae TaxID=2603600 RepID=UPI0012FAA3E4|nr:hypothetical protein [Nonomuraea typhae]
MIYIKEMSAMQWLASAHRDSVNRLADGPARFRRVESALFGQESVFGARKGAIVAPVYGVASGVEPTNAPVIAGALSNPVPTQQITKGGLCGPQPWRDAPVIS